MRHYSCTVLCSFNNQGWCCCKYGYFVSICMKIYNIGYIGRKQPNNALRNLANQHTADNMEKITNKINQIFQSDSAILPKLIPTHQHPASHMADKYCVSVDQVEKKLFAVNTKKAVAPDCIPNWIYSVLAGYFAAPIACIFHS